MNSFHSWLETVKHHSVGDSVEISYKFDEHVAFLIENNFNPVGVCGAYEDMCVAALTFELVSTNFDVYIPKERSFQSSIFMYGGLRKRLSLERISIGKCRSKIFANDSRPNFDSLVSCTETDKFYYFNRKD